MTMSVCVSILLIGDTNLFVEAKTRGGCQVSSSVHLSISSSQASLELNLEVNKPRESFYLHILTHYSGVIGMYEYLSLLYWWWDPNPGHDNCAASTLIWWAQITMLTNDLYHLSVHQLLICQSIYVSIHVLSVYQSIFIIIIFIIFVFVWICLWMVLMHVLYLKKPKRSSNPKKLTFMAVLSYLTWEVGQKSEPLQQQQCS